MDSTHEQLLYKKPSRYGKKRYSLKYRAKKPSSAYVRKYVKYALRKNIESKYHDSELIGASVDVDGYIANLCLISQGNTVLTRVGNDIRPTRLDFNYVLARADATNGMRCIIFRWKPDTASDTPSIGEVVSVSGTSTLRWTAFQEWQDRKKMEVLYDKIYCFDDDHDLLLCTGSIKLSGTISYQGSTTSGSNLIYVCFISDSSVATHPTVAGTARVVYTDA